MPTHTNILHSHKHKIMPSLSKQKYVSYIFNSKKIVAKMTSSCYYRCVMLKNVVGVVGNVLDYDTREFGH